MKKIINLFSILSIIFSTFFTLGAPTKIGGGFNINHGKDDEMNENDFFNSLFLKSTFFENWSDTNYFVNPTLKTSKPLNFKEDWYLDFLRDTYSTGFVINEPDSEILDLYKNWEKISKELLIDYFFDVKKENFLDDVTTFIYLFLKTYNYLFSNDHIKNDLKLISEIMPNFHRERDIFAFHSLKNEYVSPSQNNFFRCKEIETKMELFYKWKKVCNLNNKHFINDSDLIKNKKYFIIFKDNKYSNNWKIIDFDFNYDSFYFDKKYDNVPLKIKSNFYQNEYNLYIHKNQWRLPIISLSPHFDKNNIEKDENIFTDSNVDFYKGLYVWDTDVPNEKVDDIYMPIFNYLDGSLIFKYEWMNNFSEVYKNIYEKFVRLYINNFINENFKILRGGSSNYEYFLNNKIENSQKIIFNFEIINESKKENNFKSIFEMMLTLNEKNEILDGKISLLNFNNKKFDIEKINFIFQFQKIEEEIFNSSFVTFSFDKKLQLIIHNEFKHKIFAKKFLNSFFSNALVPVFKNRSNFIENNYLDNLTYDTVLINFFNLKLENFYNILYFENKNINFNVEIEKKFNDILNSFFLISKDFYRNYLRTIFDLEPKTYIQGYNQKYGLLLNNGFKIYPRYFYYNEQFEELNFILYSSYKNRFYKTEYGNVFNYDFLVNINNNINNKNDNKLFNNNLIQDKYKLKYKKIDDMKTGYNVFELQAKLKENYYKYFDFNFGIYNWDELNSSGMFPDKWWWQEKYETCNFYNIFCHMKNAAIWTINKIPGVKQVNQIGMSVGSIFMDINSFFNQFFDVFKFYPPLYYVVKNVFVLLMFIKLIRLF